MRPLLCLLALLAGMAPAPAQRLLVVGEGGMPWTEVQDSSAFLQVQPESVWTWEVARGENLLEDIERRGGGLYASGIRPLQVQPGVFEDARVMLNVRGVEAMADGDASTAFNPDEAGLEREVEVYVDLGGTFRIERVRLFPRLDEGHRGLYPAHFELGLGERREALFFLGGILDQRFEPLLRFARTRPNERALVEWPGLNGVGTEREVRFLRFQPLSGERWEVAELEVFADGTAPAGEYRSRPLLAASAHPVWVRVRHDGRPLEELPVVLQTRTGPDEEPLTYFVQVGAELRRVNREVWENIEGIEGAAVKGPVLSNPEWSAWETVDGGAIRSPGPNRYLQFRLRLMQPGTRLGRLVFEYATPPVAARLQAEIGPALVDAGAETAFVLSVQMRRLESEGADTGFRFVEVRTPAQIVGVDSVRVDDRPEVHTLESFAGGFAINLWRRVRQDGSLVQLFFRGRVFADGTPFQVRVLDRRQVAGEAADTVYQFAGAGDADPLDSGESLVVRLRPRGEGLLSGLRASGLFTPDGDGVNEVFLLSYSLLRLTRPAPVFFEIFDLGGRLVRWGESEDQSGRFARVWDGRDQAGARVAPGLYLYRVRVRADAGEERRAGLVGVVY